MKITTNNIAYYSHLKACKEGFRGDLTPVKEFDNHIQVICADTVTEPVLIAMIKEYIKKEGNFNFITLESYKSKDLAAKLERLLKTDSTEFFDTDYTSIYYN